MTPATQISQTVSARWLAALGITALQSLKKIDRDNSKFLKSIENRYDEHVATPTPQRLRQGGDGYRVEVFSDPIEVWGDDGKITVKTIERYRMRLPDCTLSRLVNRHSLAAKPIENLALGVAGHRYFGHWFNGGLSGIGAMDPSKTSSRTGLPPSFFGGTKQTDEVEKYWKAQESLAPEHVRIVEDVVLYDRDLEESGMMRITTTSHAKTRVSVTLDRLRCGLYELARHFKIWDEMKTSEPGA